MRIEDIPRPWLLAAMTGVSMSELLEKAKQERDEQAAEFLESVKGRRRPAVPGCAARPTPRRSRFVELPV
ncbi:MAG: hypothetical protein AAF637_08570 [Pseudomonadota bacterium]